MSFFEDMTLPWQSLLEAMPDGTALIDSHGVIQYVNELLAQLTGYSRDELVGQNVEMLVPPRLRTWRAKRAASTRRPRLADHLERPRPHRPSKGRH